MFSITFKYEVPGRSTIWIPVGQGSTALAVGADGGWMIGCIWFNGPFKQYFSLYRAVSQREGERGEKG